MNRFLSVPLAALVFTLPASAQVAPNELAKSLVADVTRAVREQYVFPEKADAIVARLDQGLASGRYNVADRERLAELLTQDLQAVTSDKHMSVKYTPEVAGGAQGAGPGGPGGPGPGPGGGGPSPFVEMARVSNQGITELKILPGNVRYMNISLFFWDEGLTQRAYDRAIEFLREGDAYIIDIRGTGGGSPASVNYLTSHLMDPGQKLMTYRLGRQAPTESRTRTDIGERRLPAKPLFLLAGPGSASAAEEFASHVKNFRLGTIVGQTTAGAGNRNTLMAVPSGFTISISVGTAIHPVTNAGWEGTGIQPDLQAPLPAALDIAHREALKRLHAAASGPKAAQLKWQIDALTAKIEPVRIEPGELAAYAGNYGAERKVSQRAGKLYYQLGAQEWELLPMGSDTFGLVAGPPLRLKFSRSGGRVAALTQLSLSGQEQVFSRS